MDKEKRSVLTRESIKKELVDQNKMLLIFGGLSTLGIWFFVAAFLFLFAGQLAAYITFVPIAFLPLLYLIPKLIDLIKVQSGRFYVVEDELTRTAEEVGYGLMFRYRLKKIFYFMRHGRYVISMSDEKSITEYSKIGDRFYLLFLEGKKKPIKVYNKRVNDVSAELVVSLKQEN
ncbi:MAG: hypothetical protein IJ011_03775 [Clostridia bacterium]|nr:hypothetical protein [Clostridia bacterium]